MRRVCKGAKRRAHHRFTNAVRDGAHAEPVIGRAFAGPRWLAMTRLAIPHYPPLPRVAHVAAGRTRSCFGPHCVRALSDVTAAMARMWAMSVNFFTRPCAVADKQEPALHRQPFKKRGILFLHVSEVAARPAICCACRYGSPLFGAGRLLTTATGYFRTEILQ